MIRAFFYFFSGEIAPFWPHVLLLAASVLAGIVVGAGIILESPKNSDRTHRIATRLVIAGIAVESLCTITLFAFDEGISHSQQAKIISLETRIAARRLDPAQRANIAGKMSKWAFLSRAADVRQLAHIGPITTDFESASLADNIELALGENGAGWTVRRGVPSMNVPYPSLAGVGIRLAGSSPRAKSIGDDLVDALKGEGVLAFIVPQTGIDCLKTNSSEKLDTDPSCSEVSIMIGSHP